MADGFDLARFGLAATPAPGGVLAGVELERILALPRRAEPSPELVLALSVALRTRDVDDDGRPVLLWPGQVAALLELYDVGGLLAPMPVGSGKTLVTLLAATVLSMGRAPIERPVLMLPATLRDKTAREFARYVRDWRVRLPMLVGYEEMGRADRERRLVEYDPDLLILDEAHYVRSLDSAVTRRVERFIVGCRAEHRACIVATLSGTLITTRIEDYQHHAVWALREHAPVPLQRSTAEQWGRALNRDTAGLGRIGLGDLEHIPLGYHAHLLGSRGVVSASGPDCTATLQIDRWRPATPPALVELIDATARSGMRPDGELLDEFDLPDCLCQLALGFFYQWDPMPPSWWLAPRRAWRAYARDVLDQRLDGYDSESQIVHALDAHATTHDPPPCPNEGRHALAAWRAVRDAFVPNPVPVWIDASVLVAAVAEAGQTDTIVWTRFRAAGVLLEQLGVPYYGGGSDPESAEPGRTIACSIAAHGTGRNLQAWHRALVLTPPANARAWEQLVGRLHRPGQHSDVVRYSVISTIDYHANVIDRVRAEASATSRASGHTQKLDLAHWGE